MYNIEFYENDIFVLLHHLQKNSQKTPRREIIRAKYERTDFLARKGAKNTSIVRSQN